LFFRGNRVKSYNYVTEAGVVLNQISSKVKGIDFSNKKGFANLKIKVDDPKGFADEISFRSRIQK